jgi:hypothetical protein
LAPKILKLKNLGKKRASHAVKMFHVDDIIFLSPINLWSTDSIMTDTNMPVTGD